MNRNIENFLLIFKEIKKYNDDEFTQDEIIKSTKDLIKYSKLDYVEKNILKNYDNDNRKPLDKVFSRQGNSNIIDYNFFKEDEKEEIELLNYQKFKKINNFY